MEKLQVYMAVNMETLLESHMLNDLSPELIRQLSNAVRGEQLSKSGYTRSSRMLDKAMAAHGAWLALQDIPEPIVRTQNRSRDQTTSSPGSGRRRQQTIDSPLASPSPVLTPLAFQVSAASGDQDIFAMDDEPPGSPSIGAQKQLSSKPSLVWRALGSAPRYVLRVFLAITSAHYAIVVLI
jgi:hypothetical protein